MTAPLQLGRYSLYAQLASGGMATVFLGRLNGEVGFGRTVAIKRLHAHLAREPEFVTMFLDEAHMAARVQHPNVIATLDIVANEDELFLVMEYVQGESLSVLLRLSEQSKTKVPVPIAVSIAIGYLSGLHAAHEATDEQGRPLSIVHRDVSPQNVLVGKDGVARLLDFGVARASMRLASTRDGQLKGKVRYMAPEQLTGVASVQTDVYAGGVVLWEALAGRRLFTGENEGALFHSVMMADVAAPSHVNPEVPPELDRIVLKALAKDPAERWQTAREMAQALDGALRPASSMAVGEWVQRTAGESLREKAALVALAESGSEPRGALAPLLASNLPRLGEPDTGSLPALFAPRTKSLPAPASPSRPPSADEVETLAASPTALSETTNRRPRFVGMAAAGATLIVGIVALLLSGGSSRSNPAPVIAVAPAAPPPAPVPAAELSPAATANVALSAAPAVSASAAASSLPVPASSNDAPKRAARPAIIGGSHGPKPGKNSDLSQLLDTR